MIGLFAVAFTLIILINFFVALFFLLKLRDSILISVPFVSTRKRAITSIINALSLSDKSILYDLGCGNAEILKVAVGETRGARGVGIERGYIPYLVSKINTRNLPIDIHLKDIFSVDLSPASHIYCYLGSEVMQKLSPKILNECKTGTRIVSCDFRLPDVPLIQTIPLDFGNDKLTRTLYVYEIQ